MPEDPRILATAREIDPEAFRLAHRLSLPIRREEALARARRIHAMYSAPTADGLTVIGNGSPENGVP